VLTLKQTGKVQKDLPVVLIGKEFWSTVINWEALFKYGTISRKDVDDLVFTDSAEEAANYIIGRLSSAAL
jgi:predicted Rossmann-fold nucleotide-binding protein